jgi:NTE family protein
LDTEINRNLQALESYVGVGIRAEGLYIEPKANPLLIDNLLGLLEYTSRNLEIDAHYVHNTLNTPFFASKGEKIKVKFSRSLRFDVRSKYDTDGVVLLEGDTNGFSKFIFSYAKHWPLHEKASFILNGQSSFIFTDPLEEGTLDFLKYGYGSQFFLGGNRGSSIEDTFVFPGLLDNELKVNQLLKLHASLQWNPLKNIYITPHINYASVSNRDFKSFSKGVFSGGDNWQSLTMARNIVSVGTTTAYNSILGPVIFDVSWVNGINKVRSSFSVGFFMGLTD